MRLRANYQVAIGLVIACGISLLVVCFALPLVSASESKPNLPWRIVWFPPNDVVPSWNWVEFGHNDYNGMRIFQTDYAQPFPDGVKEWQLGVVDADDLKRKATVPLGNPHTENSIDFSIWQPGGFRVPGERRDSKIDRLEELGEGTFLCAILGDGKRCSNVARVTIRHGFTPAGEPMIRLVAVQPYGANDPVHYIGAWIVPGKPQDANLTTTVARCPAWEVNGTWRIRRGNKNGLVAVLAPGVCRAEVYDVGYLAELPPERSYLEGNDAFHPPIEPFTHAKVRLRIADGYDDFNGLPLTAKQKAYVYNGQKVVYAPRVGAGPPGDFKTYISDVFNIQTDKDAMSEFDKAFGQ